MIRHPAGRWAILGIVATLAIHAVIWFGVAAFFQTQWLQIKTVQDVLSPLGLAAAFDPVRVTGYPFRWVVEADRLTLAGTDFSVASDDPADAATLSFGLGWPLQVALSWPGQIHVRTTGQDVMMTDPRGIIAYGGAGWSFVGSARQIVIQPLGIRPAGIEPIGKGLPFRMDSLAFGMRAATEYFPITTENVYQDTAQGWLVALGVFIPAAENRNQRDLHLDIAGFQYRWQGNPPTLDPAGIQQWALQGGTVEIAPLVAKGRDISVTGDGTFALDPAMQPLAAFSLTLEGAEHLLTEILTANGSLSSDQSRLLQGALGITRLLTGPTRIQVPLTLQDGRIYLNGTIIGTVPPIDWR